MSRIAVALPVAAGGKGDLESALPGEWTTLVLLIVLTAVLGAAVLASGVVRHRRVAVRRDEQREAYLRGRGDAYDGVDDDAVGNSYFEADHTPYFLADKDDAVGKDSRSAARGRGRERESG
jgi:hypothetical protein